MTALLLSVLLSCGDANCACNHKPADAKGVTAPTKAGPAAVGSTAAAKDSKESCNHAEAKGEAAAPAPAKADGIITRGEKLKGLPAVEMTALMAAPATFDGKTVALEGTVRKACEKKGCWMELAASDKGPSVRVTFKDYGFFVPLDSAGSKAKIEGTVKVAELTPEKAKHYQDEGAQVAKDKDGKYREVQVVALGVELRK